MKSEMTSKKTQRCLTLSDPINISPSWVFCLFVFWDEVGWGGYLYSPFLTMQLCVFWM